MSAYDELKKALAREPKRWLVTGVAGFIGSNILETLLGLEQKVVGLDNFSTGKQANLEQVSRLVSPNQWARFEFREGNIENLQDCHTACRGVDYVLHEAAIGSVPISMNDPLASHRSNVTGFLNMLLAARDAKVQRFVYASSSAVYGDDPESAKIETKIGRPLSPYAATKWINEVYADTFAMAYGFGSIGLRYFNVFGPRQDPQGAYAAVIPKWIKALIKREPVRINGDGETSRDFLFVSNVVQANLLAAATTNDAAVNQAYNVALGERTTLNQLFELLQKALRRHEPRLPEQKPVYQDFRAGDVRHSVADINKARRLLGYAPTHQLEEGLELAMSWYRENLR